MGFLNYHPSRLTKSFLKKGFLTIFMYAVGIVMLLPFIWMISSSLKYEVDVFKFPIEWIPRRFNAVANYTAVWAGRYPFGMFYLNSIKVLVLRVTSDLVTSALAAYGFARLRFKGRDVIFLLYLGSMMIPHQMLFIPRFVMFRWLGIYNTLWAVALPGMFTAFGVFLLRQYFITIPFELSEAARIDGANEFQIFSRVIVPLAKPALASLAILTSVWSWNDYQGPLIMLSDIKLYTIPLGLTTYMDEHGTQQVSLIMAAATSAILPMLLIFLAAQKHFVRGIATAGLKG